MITSHKLGLITAYYFSRFNMEALKNLDYPSFSKAFEDVSSTLGIKKNYIKLRRDEFDAAFPWREGWKRKMDKQVSKVIELFQHLEEPDVREIVQNILNNENYRTSEEFSDIASLLKTTKDEPTKKGVFIVRGPTGKLAEEYFKSYFNSNKMPISGQLNDTRDLGTGYDFEIITPEDTYFIEVKGLSAASGGILFTDKEWQTANKQGDKYFLVVVNNLKETPQISFIRNPAAVFAPKKSTYTSIQIQYTVSNADLVALGSRSSFKDEGKSP